MPAEKARTTPRSPAGLCLLLPLFLTSMKQRLTR